MTMNKALERKFEELGSCLKVREIFRPTHEDFRLNVKTDRRGEFFDLEVFRGDIAFSVVDIRPRDRHLVFMAKVPGRAARDEQKSKFLCGHDERHWFVASVNKATTSVENAKETLKPRLVREMQNRLGVKRKERNRRKNPGFIRQGEWFFVPAPDVKVDKRLILKNEPLRRGWSKPHMAELLYRTGGTLVYANSSYPSGLTEQGYKELTTRDPRAKRLRWSTMVRNPNVYVKGRVRHSDHKTIVLATWHLVALSNEATSSQNAFLD